VEKDHSHSTFTITNTLFNKIINHCTSALPYEACGLVSGKNGIAETIWEMKNHSRSTTSFSMDKEEIRAVFELIDGRNEALLGIYHSHPTDWAYPSPDDIAFNHYPDTGYLIVSFSSSTPVVKCFRIKEHTVETLQIIVIY
jgi:[CysO sulfur-carrier protein]-S-L-cysteine hydrolase